MKSQACGGATSALPEDETNVAYLDMEELAMRIAEALTGKFVPAGMSPQEAIAGMRRISPRSVESWERAARAAVDFISERCNAASPGSFEVEPVRVSEDRGTIQ